MKNTEDYLQGYRDGMSYDKRIPHTMVFMGKNMEELAKIICEHEERKFLSDEKWKWPEEDMRKLKERQKEVNEARQRREEFRDFLTAKWGSAAHVESSRIMEYYDKVHCPELLVTKVGFLTDKYPNGLIIEVDGKKVYQK
jgi:hypothetical protein